MTEEILAAFLVEHHVDASVVVTLSKEAYELFKSGAPLVVEKALARLAQEIITDAGALIQLAAGDYAKIRAELFPPAPEPEHDNPLT